MSASESTTGLAWQAGAPGHPARGASLLLAIGVAAPLIAFATVAAAMAAYPGFDNSRQYLSELGGASARLPILFNTGVFVSGILAALAGLGFALAVARLTRAWLAAGVIGLAFGLAGVGLVMSAIYHWPDPRHLAINLGLGIQIAPVLLVWGLRSRPDLRALKLFLGAVFVAMAVLTVLTKHLVFPGLVNDANVGWWERAFAIVLVGWVGVAAYSLRRRLQIEASQAPSA